MNQTNFGALIAALRKEQYDPIVGKVWSQARLARETSLSEKVIGDIERGTRSTLDEDIVIKLADAFDLNTLERREFFTLFRSVEQKLIPATDDTDAYEDCIALMQSLQLPVSLQDSYYNLIAVNQSWCRLYDVPTDFWQGWTDTAHFNFIRFLLDPNSSMRRIMGSKHRMAIEGAVNLFRWMSLPYRHTEYYSDLFSCLMMFNEFGRAWMTSQFSDNDMRSSFKTIEHRNPIFGKIKYNIAKSSIVTSEGPIYYSVLLPYSTATSMIFAQLAADDGDQVITLSPFPAVGFASDSTAPVDEMSQFFTGTSIPVQRR